MIRITQRQIASKLGLSQQAIAFALSDDPASHAQLRVETRHRILNTARRMGYVPHHAARRLASARSQSRATSFDQVGLISLVGADLAAEPVRLAMMAGGEQELSNHHASLTFVRVAEPQDWQKVERLARAGGVDGWLLYGEVNDAVMNRLKPLKLPSVILGDHRCRQRVHSVNVNYTVAARLAVQHLASLGHRRIAFLGSSMRYVYQRQTFAGYRASLKEFGLDNDERLIGDLSSWSNDTGNDLHEWLRKADPMPSAIFASEFDWASFVHTMLKERHIEVPKRISVLGCETVSPTTERENFTRIEYPMTEVGRQGARLLHRIVSGQTAAAESVSIAPSLIEGWSTARPIRGQEIEEKFV